MLHHLIDPRSGQPAHGPWRTASVVAGSCVAANTAATCALILGEGAVEWLEGQGYPTRLVAVDGTTTFVNGWPADASAADATRRAAVA